MTDKAPYEDAIAESAKAAAKALDLVKASSQQIADAYGFVIGDQLHAARQRRLDAITRKTQKILKDRDAKSTEVPEQIAIPLLEAAQGESREEMQELWARLLANAMDSDRAADVRPEFVSALKQMQPLDALVLETIREMVQDPENTVIAPGNVAERLKVRASLIRVSFDSLAEARCMTVFNSANGSQFRMGSFGVEFLRACRA